MKLSKLKRLPNAVKVDAGKPFEVLYVTEFAHDPKLLGEFRPEQRQLVIKLGQSESETTKTLFHEFLHAVSDMNGGSLTEADVLQLENNLKYFTAFFEQVNAK